MVASCYRLRRFILASLGFRGGSAADHPDAVSEAGHRASAAPAPGTIGLAADPGRGERAVGGDEGRDGGTGDVQGEQAAAHLV